MKVSLHQFSPNTPEKTFYQSGIDFLESEFDLDFENTLYLLKELKHNRSCLYVETPLYSLDFHVFDVDSLGVEIYPFNGGWIYSDISKEIGEEILRIVFNSGKFTKFMPTTNEEWGAYVEGMFED